MLFILQGFMAFASFVAKSKTVEKNSLAMNTQKTYQSQLASYEKLMQTIEDAPPPYPITEEKVRGFLEWYRATHNTTYGYLKLYVASFRFYFRTNDEADFTHSPGFKNFLEGLRREMKGDTAPNAKLFITKEKMEQIVTHPDINPEMKALASIMYSGFLRISEATNIKFSDITFDRDGRMVLKIPFSKTDQSGKAVEVYIKKTTAIYNPFYCFLPYMESTKTQDDQKIFNKSSNCYREKFKEVFKLIEIDTKLYSTHSFRKGAAHEAALAGVQDSIIKTMGRWKSTVYTRYTATTMKEASDSLLDYI